MSLLYAIYVFTNVALIVSKIPDVTSTLSHVHPAAERNRLVQELMRRLKISFKAAIRVVTLLYLVIVVITFYWGRTYRDSTPILGTLTAGNLVVCYFNIAAYYLNTGKGMLPGLRWILRWRFYSGKLR